MSWEITEFIGTTDFTALEPKARLDLALRAERHFRVRFADTEVESLTSLSHDGFVSLVRAVVARSRATRPPTRDDVVAVLAEERGGGGAIDDIESMELLWLLNSMEQRYGITLEIDEFNLTRMRTVDGAVDVLCSVLACVA